MVLYRRGGEKMYKERVESCGKRIAEALRIKGMKQYELCKLANVPKSSLSLYLSGAYEPKQDRVYDMAKALNVNEAWLMGYDVPMERQVKKDSPSETELSEGEQMWLELYHRLSSETRELLIKTIGSFDSLSEDKQKLALQMLRVALGGQ
jgi:transcriptional regulator with XRE-family HTH domain